MPRDDAKRRREECPKSVGDGGSLSAMTARGRGVVRCRVVFCPCAVCGNAYDRPGRVRWPGRHGGEASALCVGSDDVGLDSSVTSHQGEGTR